MANEVRLRQDFLSGTTTDNPLSSGATTLNSAALAGMVAVTSTSHLPIVLDPEGVGGAPEIAWVTAHTAAATSATILRAQEGTAARSHAAGTAWLHGPSARDFAGIDNVTVANSSTAYTVPDVTNATTHRVTMTGNCTFTFPPAGVGKSFRLDLVQDDTGSRTAVWPATVRWAGGTVPTLTVTDGGEDLLEFSCLDGANWIGRVLAQGVVLVGSVIALDPFTRANSTSTMGTVPGYGQTWTPLTGTWGISSNQAYSVGPTDGAVTAIDVGTADQDVSVKIANLTSTIYPGPCVRIADISNFYHLQASTTGMTLLKNVGGSFSTVASIASVPAAGDVIRLVVKGTSLKSYRNGALVNSTTDSALVAGNKAGFRQASISATSCLYDDFTVTVAV